MTISVATDDNGNERYPWPAKGLRPFIGGADWRRFPRFAGEADQRDSYMWDGYLKAGELLIEAWYREYNQPNHFISANELIYPILFNYRHGLEVALKCLINEYGPRVGAPPAPLDHDLWALWGACRQIIAAIAGEGNPEEVNAVEQVMKDFHDLDRAGIAFRYSTDKNGQLIALPQGALDLDHLREVMCGIGNFFECVDTHLHHVLSDCAL